MPTALMMELLHRRTNLTALCPSALTNDGYASIAWAYQLSSAPGEGRAHDVKAQAEIAHKAHRKEWHAVAPGLLRQGPTRDGTQGDCNRSSEFRKYSDAFKRAVHATVQYPEGQNTMTQTS